LEFTYKFLCAFLLCGISQTIAAGSMQTRPQTLYTFLPFVLSLFIVITIIDTGN
jgi:hypothetical protein